MPYILDGKGEINPDGIAIVHVSKTMAGIEAMLDGSIRMRAPISSVDKLSDTMVGHKEGGKGEIFESTPEYEREWGNGSSVAAVRRGLFRTNIHFALNHKVSGHMMGNWDDAKYTVIGNLKKTMEASGKPSNLLSVDTYWNVGPGELTIPDAILIEPGEGIEPGSFFRIDSDNHVSMKMDGFTIDDFDDDEIRNSIWRAMRHAARTSSPEVPQGAPNWASKKFLYSDFQDMIERLDIAELKKNNPGMDAAGFARKIARLLHEANPRENLYSEYDVINEVRYLEYWAEKKEQNGLEKTIETGLNQEFRKYVSKESINRILRHFGYDVLIGGGWNISDSQEITYRNEDGTTSTTYGYHIVQALCKYSMEIGALYEPHSYSFHENMLAQLCGTKFSQPMDKISAGLQDKLSQIVLEHEGFIKELETKERSPQYLDEDKEEYLVRTDRERADAIARNRGTIEQAKSELPRYIESALFLKGVYEKTAGRNKMFANGAGKVKKAPDVRKPHRRAAAKER